MKVILNIDYSSGETEQIEFNKHDTFVVGRAKTNTHSQLKGDKYISRHHFILEVNPPDCFLKDLGSTNGTKINGVKLAKGEIRKLFKGDEIYVGRTTLSIDIQEESFDSTILKVPEVRCIECDKILLNEMSDKKSEEFLEIIYCKECLEKKAKISLIKINKLWFENAKKVLKHWPKKIDIHCLEPLIEKEFTRDELINTLRDLKFSEKQIEMMLKHAVDSIKAITCYGCNKIITEMANRNGQGEIIRDNCVYFCPHCRPEREGNISCKSLGDYELIKLLSSGGMGEIYKAWHTITGRIVVLKKISPQIIIDEKAYKLFQREIAVMARLKHPNIVHLYEHGRIDNNYYFITEFMNGGDVGELIKKKLSPLPYEMACNIVCQILQGLEFAHTQNYIHRDIKPDNILLSTAKDGIQAKLSDFGLAKNFQDAGGSMLTQEKEFMGTLLFMPPEQLRNYRYVKPPSDLYSMGVTLYYLLTGKYIFEYPSPLDLLMASLEGKKIDLNQYEDPLLMILGTDPIPVEKYIPHIPDRLARIVNKSIMKNEQDRYLSAREFREDIRRAIGTS